MDTVVIRAADTNTYAAGIAQAAQALRDGALVIFPTETVYGVAASARSPAAVELLRKTKGRSNRQPFAVHLGQSGHARRYLTTAPPVFRRLARKVWPGPLTLVIEEPSPQKTEVGAGCSAEQLAGIYTDGKVGLRCPDHSAATRLLNEAGVPVVASSANPHGYPPPCDATGALKHLHGVVRFAIDAGQTRFGNASTVVEVCGNDWVVRREGTIDAQTIGRLARSEVLFVCTGNSCRSPMAEFMFRHLLAERLGCVIDDLEPTGYAVTSAGTMSVPDGVASTGALGEMGRRSIDVSTHRSRPITVELIHRSERIYVMSPEHRKAVLDLVPTAAGRVDLLDSNGPIADPFGGSEAEYRRCADHIQRAIETRMEEFLDEDSHWQ